MQGPDIQRKQNNYSHGRDGNIIINRVPLNRI